MGALQGSEYQSARFSETHSARFSDVYTAPPATMMDMGTDASDYAAPPVTGDAWTGSDYVESFSGTAPANGGAHYVDIASQ